jgi:hypothetical protein
VKLESPRWPGGPELCEAKNRPAFESPSAAADYAAKNCPSLSVKEVSECASCGRWHFKAEISGDGAYVGGAPAGFVGFMRESTKARIESYKKHASSRSTSQPELGKAAPPPEAASWKGPWCAKCDWPVKAGKCSNKECVTHEKRDKKPKRLVEGGLF